MLNLHGNRAQLQRNRCSTSPVSLRKLNGIRSIGTMYQFEYPLRKNVTVKTPGALTAKKPEFADPSLPQFI